MLYAILLGFIQGVTEFLPISSSGHLALIQSVLPGFTEPGMAFDIILHAGTLVAVIVFYHKDLIWMTRGAAGKLDPAQNTVSRLWLKGILIATVPAGLLGVAAHDYVENLFEKPIIVSVLLCCTGGLLFAGEWLKKRQQTDNGCAETIDFRKSIWIGCAQALALLPGISRSGSTMAAGLSVKLSRETAARFSFLLMIPAVSGAVLLKIPDLIELTASGNMQPASLASGFTAAFISGYFSIKCLLKIIRKYSFRPFGIYCMAAGILSLVLQTL